jgi:hypothetical protein
MQIGESHKKADSPSSGNPGEIKSAIMEKHIRCGLSTDEAIELDLPVVMLP